MRVLTQIIGAATLIFSTTFSAEIKEAPTPAAMIKVLVKKNADGALLEVKGPYKVYDPATNKYLSSGFRSKRLYLSPKENGIKWGESFQNIFQIRIVPNDLATAFLIDGMEYRGSVEIYNVEGELFVVNEVDIESYIKSILTSRFYETAFSAPALEAIAVVERTKAYYLAQNSHSKYWHTEADEAYLGTATQLLSRAIDMAVDTTKSMILTYNGLAFPAELTENCAGMTANYKSIFRKSASTPEGVEAPIARKNRQNTFWSFKIHKDDLAHLAKLHRITGVDLFLDSKANRAYALRIKDGSRLNDITYFNLRDYIGKDKLKSNDFTVTLEKDYVLFQGFGEGHGTGLCLYSGEQMAKRGDSMQQILSEFFPHTRLSEMKALNELAYEKFSEAITPNLDEEEF